MTRSHARSVPIRLLRACVLGAAAVLILTAVPVSAHTPTPGAARGPFVPDQLVYYHWASSTYPSWLTAAAQDSLDTKFRNWNANNSHSPRPAYGGGSAIVTYSRAVLSPCNSSPNPDWLACVTSGRSSAFRLFIRDFANSSKASWGWWDETQTCLRSGRSYAGCWYLQRAVIHEAGHAIPGFGHDDTKTEDDSVMRSIDPTVSAYGGNHYVFQRCDQAALQLVWDVAKYSLPYGDCFDSVDGHGARGLVTSLTSTGGTVTSCTSAYRLMRGRLAVASDTRYGPLADNPLGGRTIWFDRKRTTDSTWTLNAELVTAGEQVTGYNWSRAFSTPAQSGGTYNYRAHFDGDSGLDPSNRPVFSINWIYGC